MFTAGVFGKLSHCRAGQADINDALSSFPSGHSSAVFAGLGFLSWVLYGLYRPHPLSQPDARGKDLMSGGSAVAMAYESRVAGCLPKPPLQILWAICSFVAFALCVWVAVSRTRDYW